LPEYLKLVPEDEAAAAQPSVWLLLGERHGDNAQVMALGRALGWPFEVKQLYFDPDCPIPFSKRGSSLIGLDVVKSDALNGPWPDVVIAIGRRAAPISRWIKDQSDGAAMTVHLGRPRDAYYNYDLIFTTPQYGLPPGENVTKLTFPITLNNEADLDEAAKLWESRLAHLPRPWTAMILGGPTTQLRFDRDVGAHLLAKAEAHLNGRGSLLITTSPRTSLDVADLMQTQIKSPHFLFRWSRTEPNHYLAFLKLADAFIVTNDSVSMIAEAVDRQKPLFIYELPDRQRPTPTGLGNSMRRHFRIRRETRQLAGIAPDLIDVLYDALTRLGKARPRRNTAAFNQKLYQLGLARPLGATVQHGRAWATRRVTEEERHAAVSRIKEVYAAKHRPVSS
jgi:mitochondrial fission protein ELM1